LSDVFAAVLKAQFQFQLEYGHESEGGDDNVDDMLV